MNHQQTRALVKLREILLRNELMPGERVAGARLAALLGVSRMPVRRAVPAALLKTV